MVREPCLVENRNLNLSPPSLQVDAVLLGWKISCSPQCPPCARELVFIAPEALYLPAWGYFQAGDRLRGPRFEFQLQVKQA